MSQKIGRNIESADGGSGFFQPFACCFGVWFFGAEDLVIKWTTVFFYGIAAVLGTRLWERFLTPPFLKIWYACFFMLCPFYLVPFHPWSSVYALVFMLLGVEWQLRFLEKGNWKFLFGAGACAVGAFLCRTPCGIVAFCAGAATLFLRGICAETSERRFAPLLPYCGGALGAGSIFALYLTLAGAWGDYLRQCYTFIFGFVVRRGGSWSWEQFSDSMLPLTGSFGFGNSIFALLPILALGALLVTVRPLFYGKKEQLRKNLPLIAMILLALGSWHQYFPVPCVRHLYWAGIPLFGCFALTAQGIWGLKSSREVRLLLVGVLLVPLLFCFYCRAIVLLRYFQKLPDRVTATAPGISGLWVFQSENELFNTLSLLFRELPPEVRKRGVLNHTPDGIYSLVFPSPAGFDHPMFVNWGDEVYPTYREDVLKFLHEKRCAVISTELTELPGYTMIYGFKHFEKEFRFFVPEI